MTKFILPGFLLILLASLMKPTLGTDATTLKGNQKVSTYIAAGSIIRNTRISRGLSSDDLAYLLNLSNFEVEKIEANEVVPSKELLDKINEVLKSDISTEK